MEKNRQHNKTLNWQGGGNYMYFIFLYASA